MSDTVLTGAPQGTPPAATGTAADLLGHADDNLVLAQRLGEWISKAPELELDIALGNIGLDHLGVARSLYQYLGGVEGKTEDDYAMGRTDREYRNLLLVEQPNGDFAQTIVRQFFIDCYQLQLWPDLADSADDVVAGIAARALKEASYHHRFSHGWMLRMAGGTEESRTRAQAAIDGLWRFTGEMFSGAAAGYHDGWERLVGKMFAETGLGQPDDPYQRSGGRVGYHTEHLGFLLAEMQWTQRTYPGLDW